MLLVVLTGLPGTGKSTIARAIARELRAAYFAVDFVFGFLEREGLTDDDPHGKRPYALVRELAAVQLDLGASVVVDAVNPFAWTRSEFLGLASERGIAAVLVATTCSDPSLHREHIAARLERSGNGAAWSEVERQVSYYEPPGQADLWLDATNDLDQNIDRAVRLVRTTPPVID